MSILSSLYSGASGLTAQSQGISVVGDNIANVNTVGYKASRGSFVDVLGMVAGGRGGLNSQIGLGVRFGGVDQSFSQGSFMSTGRSTDLALQGGGFFMVRGENNGHNGYYYTRAGQFHLDPAGYLVDSGGLQVQGYGADSTGRIGSSLGALQLGPRTLSPRPTGLVSAHAALDMRAAPPPAFNVIQAATTSNYSTSVPVYDSLGNEHKVQIYFRNTGVNGTWEWHGVVDGGELNGGVPGTPVDVARGTLVFSNTGALTQVTTAANTFNFTGAAPGQVVAFDFGDAIAAGGTGKKGSTALAQPFSINSLNQDGYPPGTFSQLQVGADGTVTGVFTNGQRQALGKVAVAAFPADVGLRREGNALWSATFESGEPMIGAAGTGARGQIVAGALEQSNVDLADQFVQMIALQRGFQANSKTVQTSDENYVTLVQLKR
jgi:flagellar hook protein FlgE